MSNDTFGIQDLTHGANSAFGIAGGIKQGGVQGSASAAINAGKLAGQATNNPQLSGGAGVASNLLGIYQGLETGGVSGYAQAGVNAYSLLEGAGQGAGALNVGLAVYNEAKNWQSGATAPDAIGGAESGAAVGTMILPGIGTAIGAVAGAALGALSSVFGSGKVDPENVPFNGYTQAFNKLNGNPQAQAQLATMVTNPYLPLAGYFDLRSGQLKGSNPIYDKYGRKGEQRFTTDLANQINLAASQGVISQNDTPQTVYSKVVAPWISQMGNWNDANKGALQGLFQQMTAQYMNGTAQQQWKAVGGDQPFTNLPKFGALGFGPNQAQQIVQQTVKQPLQSAVLSFPSTASTTNPGAQPSSMLPLVLAGVGGMALGAGLGGTQNQLQAGGPGGDPSASSGTGGTDTSWLSNLSSGVSNFLNSPAGNVAEFGTLAGLGEVQASQQKTENQQEAGSISTLGQPYSAAGAAELGQLQGGPQVSGPLGSSIKQQTDTAAELGDVAKQYGTGNLTSAQQQQVSDYVKQQRAMVDSQLAASGNTDGSARDAAYQQIDDNAAQLSQSLTQGNLQISQQALTTVQQTYNGLLNQALTQSEFGLGAQEQAVQILIQGDTQLSQSLNQLFAGIAQGFGTAMGGGKSQAPATGTSGTIGQIGRAVAGQGAGGVASSAAGGAPFGGSSDVASTDNQNQVSSQLDSSTWQQEQANQTDVSTQLDQSLYNFDPNSITYNDPFGAGSDVSGDISAGDPFGG